MLLDLIDRQVDEIFVVFRYDAIPDRVGHGATQVCKCFRGSDHEKLVNVIVGADRLQLFGDHG